MLRRGLVAFLCLFLTLSCGSNESSRLSTDADSLHYAAFDKRELAHRFAPIVRHHAQELYLPMDPETFLREDETSRTEDFFLSARSDYLRGRQGRTIVNISEDGRSIQYWIFYAKNGCQGAKVRFRVTGPIKIGSIGEANRTLELCNLANHEGDWENFTVKLNADRTQIETAYLSSHGIGNWLPASALESRDNRPFLYVALNSHAIYPKDIGFQADTTIAHGALDGILGIEWMQIGDIISEPAYVQKNPSDGMLSAIDYDTQRALVLYEDIQNSSLKNWSENWGRPVNAKEVLELPQLAIGPIEWILKTAIKVALQVVPELKEKSNGAPVDTPWVRSSWNEFDANKSFGSSGISFDSAVGGTGGKAFSDYDRLKDFGFYKAREIIIHSGDRIDQVCLNLDAVGDLCHGQSTRNERRLALEDGEFIQKQELAIGTKDKGRRIFAIRFTTNFGRSIEGGRWTHELVTHTAPDHMQIVGWHGSSGDEVDNLGPLYGTLSH